MCIFIREIFFNNYLVTAFCEFFIVPHVAISFLLVSVGDKTEQVLAAEIHRPGN